MRPHDLLRLKSATMLALVDAPADIPAWVAMALARAPFVVVRRAEIRDGRIPIGIRGESREQRYPATIPVENVAQTITPEALAQSAAWCTHLRNSLPAFAALDRVADAAAEFGLVWGPGGSVGFELASGTPAVHADSDLDVIVRPSTQHTRTNLARFRQRIGDSEVRIDIVIEGAQGAVSLDEWIESPQRVLIKTAQGPQLGAYAW